MSNIPYAEQFNKHSRQLSIQDWVASWSHPVVCSDSHAEILKKLQNPPEYIFTSRRSDINDDSLQNNDNKRTSNPVELDLSRDIEHLFKEILHGVKGIQVSSCTQKE